MRQIEKEKKVHDYIAPEAKVFTVEFESIIATSGGDGEGGGAGGNSGGPDFFE